MTLGTDDCDSVSQVTRHTHKPISTLLLWLQLTFVSSVEVISGQVLLPGSRPEVHLQETCDDFSLSGVRRGVIFSHENGAHYRPNTNCRVVFGVSPGHQVKFEFEHFWLQKRVGGECVDFVQFFDGERMDTKLTEPLCGHVIPEPLAFSHNASQVALLFHTNHKHEAQGFKLHFERSRLRGCKGKGKCGARDSTGSNTGHRIASNSTSSISGFPAAFLIFPALVALLVIYVRVS